MNIERKKHIQTLDYMISQTHVEPYKSALVAAHNRLIQDEWQANAGIRTPEEWPYCSKCGTPYNAQPTGDKYTRHVAPGCSCHADVAWYERPAGSSEWVYEPGEQQITNYVALSVQKVQSADFGGARR